MGFSNIFSSLFRAPFGKGAAGFSFTGVPGLILDLDPSLGVFQDATDGSNWWYATGTKAV